MLVSLDKIVHLHLQNISTRQDLRRFFTEIQYAEINYKPVETSKWVFRDPVSFFRNFYFFDHDFQVSLWKMLQMWSSCVTRNPNRPRSIHQYSILTWLRGLRDKLLYLVVFSLFPSLLGIERRKKLKRCAIYTRMPRSHVRIMIYRLWPMVMQPIYCNYCTLYQLIKEIIVFEHDFFMPQVGGA